MTVKTTKVREHTLTALRKIQGYQRVYDLPKEHMMDIIDRLVQVELARIENADEFSVATYAAASTIIKRNDADGHWVSGEEIFADKPALETASG